MPENMFKITCCNCGEEMFYTSDGEAGDSRIGLAIWNSAHRDLFTLNLTCHNCKNEIETN